MIPVNLNSFNTSNVKSMDKMFSGCNKLKTIDLKNFITRNLKSSHSMFSDCSPLVSLDLSNSNTSALRYAKNDRCLYQIN